MPNLDPYTSIVVELSAFFTSLNQQQRENPEQVALRYAERFTDRERLRKLRLPVGDAGLYNMAISSTTADLTTLTKRVTLISDTLLLSHFRQGSMYQCRSGRDGDYTSLHWYLRCPDPTDLGRWLLACEQRLRSGVLVYHPDLVAMTETEPEYYGSGIPVNIDLYRSTAELSERALASLIDVVVQGRKIVDVVTKDPLKVQLLHRILEVELPYLEGTSLADFCAITTGEVDAYEAFRSFLRQTFLGLDQASESEQLHRELAKIGEDLRDGVRRVDAELKRIRSRRAVSVTGATVATVGAVLVLVFGQDLAQAMSLLGASGGIWGLVNAAQAYNEQRSSVAERPYYYLWLLRRSSGRPPVA